MKPLHECSNEEGRAIAKAAEKTTKYKKYKTKHKEAKKGNATAM